MQTPTNFYDWARFADCLNPEIESRDPGIGVIQSRNPGIEKWSGIATPTRDVNSQDRDETETSALETETRPRRLLWRLRRDRDKTETRP